MSTQRKLTIIFGLLSLGLLVSLLVKLFSVPGGLILSGFFMGSIGLIGIIIVCLVLAALFKRIFRKISFAALLAILTTAGFTWYHYNLYSPTLTVTVPNGFIGEVNLVLSNVKDNVLTVDSNGIGYIDRWTFEKVYTKPIVRQVDGKSLDSNLVGYNPSAFWAKSSSQGSDGKRVSSLAFEIVPDSLAGKKQYFSNYSPNYVDKKLVLGE